MAPAGFGWKQSKPAADSNKRLVKTAFHETRFPLNNLVDYVYNTFNLLLRQ